VLKLEINYRVIELVGSGSLEKYQNSKNHPSILVISKTSKNW
jgi:hypothetical protein